jgi:O-antigen ligase
MLYTAVFSFASFLAAGQRRGRWFLAMFALLFVSLLVTVTRSLVGLSLAGCFLATVLGTRLGIAHRAIARVAYGAVAFAAMVVALLMSPYGEAWIERIDDFSNDSRIFSEETVRGINNLSALEAIQARPLWGYGMARYPDAYSRVAQISDIHPLLEVGLFGGVAAIVLAVRLHWLLLSGFWLACKAERLLALRMLPYFTIFALSFLVNSAGAGGSLAGTGLLGIAVFAGLMAADFADPDTMTAGTGKASSRTARAPGQYCSTHP